MQGPSSHLKFLGGPSPQSSPRSPPLSWILVSRPLVLCNYDNYCLQYQAGPTHLSRILKLLKSWIMGRDLAPNLEGTKKFLSRPNFRKTFIFRAKISDDLFLVIDLVLRIFPFFSHNFLFLLC